MLGLLAAGCSGGRARAASHRGSHATVAARPVARASSVRLSITPAGGIDGAPDRGITVRAVGGRISEVVVRAEGATRLPGR